MGNNFFQIWIHNDKNVHMPIDSRSELKLKVVEGHCISWYVIIESVRMNDN